MRHVPQDLPPPDQVCGGISSNSNTDACGFNTFCCNQTSPATCAAGINLLPSDCITKGNACQMTSPVRACVASRDSACINAAGSTHNGSYCCAAAAGGPGFSRNVVNLTIFNGDGCKDPQQDFCLITTGPTPTPTPTPKPTPTPTPKPTPTPTPKPTPTPTPTPTPAPSACNLGSRELAVVNKSSEQIWIGGSGGALRAVCVLPDNSSCIPPDGAFAQNGNCSCTAGQPNGGKLACPGTSTLANGGQNCVASTCESGKRSNAESAPVVTQLAVRRICASLHCRSRPNSRSGRIPGRFLRTTRWTCVSRRPRLTVHTTTARFFPRCGGAAVCSRVPDAKPMGLNARRLIVTAVCRRPTITAVPVPEEALHSRRRNLHCNERVRTTTTWR